MATGKSRLRSGSHRDDPATGWWRTPAATNRLARRIVRTASRSSPSGTPSPGSRNWSTRYGAGFGKGHNRDYAALNEETCADLIESFKAEGRQNFPAIVRRVEDDPEHDWEVICGARRHWTVSWMRAHHQPDFKFLIEPRELTDEEAFRLADLENRSRRDLSDYERARRLCARSRSVLRRQSTADGRTPGGQQELAQPLSGDGAIADRYCGGLRLTPCDRHQPCGHPGAAAPRR